jgi:DNA-binding response OmpR family regulator
MENPSPRVLVVEDDAAVRDMTVETLARQAFVVDSAASAEDALEQLRGGEYPVVVSDIRLPGASGLELLRRIKALDPAPEVVLMTGFASLESAIEAVNLGACWYIQKPFTAVQLGWAVRKALDIYRLRREKDALIARQKAMLEGLRDSVAWIERKREELLRAERKRTFKQTVAALRHELNNHGMGIAAAAGAARRFVEKGKAEDVLDALTSIEAFVLDISLLLGKASDLEDVRTVHYVDGEQIVDLGGEE